MYIRYTLYIYIVHIMYIRYTDMMVLGDGETFFIWITSTRREGRVCGHRTGGVGVDQRVRGPRD